MFRLRVLCRGLSNHFHRVKINSVVKYQPTSTIVNEKTIQAHFYSSQTNKDDVRIRHFYEYSDVDYGDSEISYSQWEGAENRFAHSIMEQRLSYETTIVRKPSVDDALRNVSVENLLEQNWKTATTTELLEAFRKLSVYAHENLEDIHAEKYENIIQALIARCSKLDDERLFHVLRSLMLWQIESNHGYFRSLCSAIDTECRWRAVSWPVERLLFVSDHWYRLRFIRTSKFVRYAMKKLGRDPSRLSGPNLVQYMFYVNVHRKISLVDSCSLERQLSTVIDELDIDEIAVLCLGFFKSQTPIRGRQLLTNIIKRTIADISSINEISLAAILKIVRYSIHINDLDFLCELLEYIKPQISRLSLQCLMHVILAAANRGLFYADLLNTVTARFYREIKSVRVKDIKSLVFALSSFNFIPETQPNILERVTQELNEGHRQNELNEHPGCFAHCLHYLSILNVHPKNLIAQVLDPCRVKDGYGPEKHMSERQLLSLDLNIDAEIPDYTGPRLDKETRKSLALRLTDPGPLPTNRIITGSDWYMLDILDCLENYFGSRDLFHVDHVLPQYEKPDIIICLNEKNFPIPVGNILSRYPLGSVKRRPEVIGNNKRWLAIIIARYTTARNTSRVLGQFCAKQRQLKCIGYEPRLLLFHEWEKLHDDYEKLRYLHYNVFR